MFYRIKEEQLYDYAEYKYSEECLFTDIITQEELNVNPNKVIIQDGVLILNPDYENEEAQKELERIKELFMTRSDFFDGTIRAFGVGQEELRLAIIATLGNLPVNEIEKKVALNNYDNALNFYRKHPLFDMLSDVEIPIGENVAITITSEQWDNFFNETDKDNQEAYKELLPQEPTTEEETIEEEV